MDEIDIWRAAKQMRTTYGDDAGIEAAVRADIFLSLRESVEFPDQAANRRDQTNYESAKPTEHHKTGNWLPAHSVRQPKLISDKHC
jgi:hypothetical protein